MKRFKNTRKGFTLIELLVVIAIIGVLSAVIITNLQEAKVRALDAKRKGDLVQLRNALEIYFNSHNGTYPPGTGETSGWIGNSYQANSPPDPNISSTWIPGLISSGAISTLPQDPQWDPTEQCGGWGGAYLYQSNSSHYKVLSHNPQNSDIDLATLSDPFDDPVRDPNYSPGASCRAWMITDKPENPDVCQPFVDDNNPDCSPGTGQDNCPDHPICW